jgi:uncharacterized RDD family membrane protein YckC
MGTNNTGQLDLSHWALRLVAYIIDSIIIGIVAWIIVFVVFAAFLFSGGLFFFAGFWLYFLLFPFIFGILEVIVFAIFDVSWSATIGKRILGFQVQTVSGGKVDFGKAFIRNISKIYPLLLLLDWIIGVATAGDKRQKYTDRIAGTVVVQIKQAFQSASPPPPPPPT